MLSAQGPEMPYPATSGHFPTPRPLSVTSIPTSVASQPASTTSQNLTGSGSQQPSTGTAGGRPTQLVTVNESDADHLPARGEYHLPSDLGLSSE